APSTAPAKTWRSDLEFFKKALKQAADRNASTRVVDVGWQAADAAIHLGRASDAEDSLTQATTALEKAPALSTEEKELARARFGALAGEIAQLRFDWKAALASYSGAEQR